MGAKLTPEASRAARGLLNWSMRELAAQAGVSLPTIQRFEGGGETYVSTADKLSAAFAAHGVEILNGDSPGARMKPKG